MFNFRKLESLRREDLLGDVLEISRTIEVSPVMVVRQLLKLEGLPKKAVKETIEGTIPPPDYLKEPLEIALQNDPVFSPKGIRRSKERGKMGEMLIAEWLDSLGIEYHRDLGQGGPDLHLTRTLKIEICGTMKEFNWIESKASFGDMFEMKRDRPQFRKYAIFGNGLIFFWFGANYTIDYDVFTWEDLVNRVDPTLKRWIQQYISYIPPEFKHLIT